MQVQYLYNTALKVLPSPRYSPSPQSPPAPGAAQLEPLDVLLGQPQLGPHVADDPLEVLDALQQ